MDKVGIYQINDTKFNEVRMSLRVILDLKKESVTKANVLSQLFSDRLQKYPTKKLITEAQDLAYGMKYSTRTYGVGKYLIIELSLRGINERFVEEKLHEIYVDFILETFKRPLINEETFAEAKKNVNQDIKSATETPNYYAITKAFELAGGDQTFGISLSGYADDLETMTLNDMLNFHERVVNESFTEWYMMGDLGDVYVESMKPLHIPAPVQTNIEADFVFETHDLSQSELVQVYQINIKPGDRLYYPYLLFLGILGQSPSSYLFKNIREKESLCYSIYASQLIYDGLFYISTSFDSNNEAVVLSKISEQFELMKRDDLDLYSAKQYQINKLSGISESTRKSIDFVFRNNRLGMDDTPADLMAAFEKVTEAEVKEVLSLIEKPFIFVYRGVQDA